MSHQVTSCRYCEAAPSSCATASAALRTTASAWTLVARLPSVVARVAPTVAGTRACREPRVVPLCVCAHRATCSQVLLQFRSGLLLLCNGICGLADHSVSVDLQFAARTLKARLPSVVARVAPTVAGTRACRKPRVVPLCVCARRATCSQVLLQFRSGLLLLCNGICGLADHSVSVDLQFAAWTLKARLPSVV